MDYRKKIVAVDVDGTLAKGVSWDEEACLNAEPVPEMIAWVNRIAREAFVIIYTARRDHLIYPTIQWLRKHNVEFHAISNRKMAADFYVDDRNHPSNGLHELTEKK